MEGKTGGREREVGKRERGMEGRGAEGRVGKGGADRHKKRWMKRQRMEGNKDLPEAREKEVGRRRGKKEKREKERKM